VSVQLNLCRGPRARIARISWRKFREVGYRTLSCFLDRDLAQRLTQAAGFRNLVAHAYETLDMERVHRAAIEGPNDLRAFLAGLRDLLG